MKKIFLALVVITALGASHKVDKYEGITYKSIKDGKIVLKCGKVITQKGSKAKTLKKNKRKAVAQVTEIDCKDILFKTKNKKNSRNTKGVIKTARGYLGVKYRYGGVTTKGIDCSAFVQKVYKKHGKHLPRTSTQQASAGKHIDKKNLKTGDLVFFGAYGRDIGHVGIYLGNNKFIHASSAAKKVTISNLDKKYYKKHYKGARRL